MEGASPGQDSVDSLTKKSSASSSGRSRNCKEFLRRFVDSEILAQNLTDWFDEIAEKSSEKAPFFDVPFELVDLQKFDYALEGILFQQLIRMPNAVDASAYVAVEDFLHAGVKGLWEAFWGEDEPLPFHVACLYDKNMKFYQAEKAISSGKLEGLCATAILLKNPRHPHGRWEDILEIALLRPDIGSLVQETSSILGEALFFAIRILLSRSLGKSNFPIESSISVLLVDSQYCRIVKVEGDVSKLVYDVNNVYECAADWVKNYSRISVSPINRIWNELGNANWSDIGALQVLFSIFHAITLYAGTPKHSIEDLAADHSSRIHTRRTERHVSDTRINENGLLRFQQHSVSPEIVEIRDESIHIESEKIMKLAVGSVVYLEDSYSQKGYQIEEVIDDGDTAFYIAFSMEDSGNYTYLYIGSHPSQVEPACQDMELWYQVQRQTKVLTIMKQKGISEKYLPQLVVSGRVSHPGSRRNSPGGNCHPLCGTPVLVTSPVGRTVADMARNGEFGSNEAIKCCHDCLSALSTVSSAGIRHGDIRPENIIIVKKSSYIQPYYVLIGWGHAILGDRDRPALNLHFSSTYALQEGKLCSASDAESLVYLIYFSFGGEFPDLDSFEGVLQWRESAWSKRLIQQKLGEISAVLKAFADYVDSLCGTPYPVDYGLWIRRLRSHIHVDDHGKEIVGSS